MTENEARHILSNYRELDDDTGEEYGYIIQECCGKDGEGYVFRCKAEGAEYDETQDLPLLAVYPEGMVLIIPNYLGAERCGEG